MEDPLVSVIVPAFNAEATLEETLRSALAQTVHAIEVIVVDDGSQDATAEVAGRIAAADSRVQLVRRQNGGPGAARNVALRLARGRFVAPLDADDLWHPQKLEKQVAAALAAEPVSAFVYCFFRGIDSQGYVLPPAEALALEGDIFLRHVYKNVVGNGSGALFLRSAMLAAGGYDERRTACEDFYLQLKIARQYTVRAVPEFLVGYRIGAATTSADRDAQHRGWCMTIAAVEKELGPLPKALLRWSRGAAAVDLAGSRLRTGRPLAAATALLQAFRYDPDRTSARVLERLALRLRRHPTGRRVRFADLDSSEEFDPSASGNGWASRRLRRLDAARLRRLDAVERSR